MDSASVSDADLSDYEVLSTHSGLDSSLADLDSLVFPSYCPTQEPPPTQAAREQFRETVGLKRDDIQAFVAKTLEKTKTKGVKSSDDRMVKVYVDGLFDGFNVAHAHQLRQAKLSFPSVHLIVGVFSDELCESYDCPARLPHVERCELVRHCRWVDEVLPEAPWRVDEYLLRNRRIDYVAVEEGITVDPRCHSARLKGYDEMKSLGKIIYTKRTKGLSTNASIRASPTTPLPPADCLLVPTPHSSSKELECRKDVYDDIPEPNGQMDVFGIGI